MVFFIFQKEVVFPEIKERFEKKEDKNEKVENKNEKAEPKKEEIKAEPKATVDFSKMTVAELREAAKDKDIKGYSTMKKAELIDALK